MCCCVSAPPSVEVMPGPFGVVGAQQATRFLQRRDRLVEGVVVVQGTVLDEECGAQARLSVSARPALARALDRRSTGFRRLFQ